MLRYARSANLKKEEAVACVGPQLHRRTHFKIVFKLVLTVKLHIVVISKFQLWGNCVFSQVK